MAHEKSEMYHIAIGQIFLFNINVGTAVLALPLAFAHTGWLLSAPIIIMIGLISFITFTFVIESMSIANAIIKLNSIFTPETNELCYGFASKTSEYKEDDNISTTASSIACSSRQQSYYGTLDECDESHVYEISKATEFGKIAKLVLRKKGVIFIYFCVCLFLFGDLSVYCSAISKTLRDFTCTHRAFRGNETLLETDICWKSLNISRICAYRFYVVCVMLVLGPFTYFNLHGTRFLQLFTLLFRLFAFASWITLASIALIEGKGAGRPAVAEFKYIPTFFGVAIFAFINHQTLPSILTPIKQKKHLLSISFLNFIVTTIFYLMICFTAAFTFRNLRDIYSINFVQEKYESVIPQEPFLSFILPLYPVFTISTNFPINAIILRNNLSLLITSSSKSFHSSFWFQRIVIPTITLIPIFCITISTTNIEWLVSLVGNYGGILVQCLIPCILLLNARKRVKQICDSNPLCAQYLNASNKYKAPFASNIIIYSILVWTFLCLTLITVDIIPK